MYEGGAQPHATAEVDVGHTINIEGFVVRAYVDGRYLDKPYYLAPEDKVSREPSR